jgi:hypothetical protein
MIKSVPHCGALFTVKVQNSLTLLVIAELK